MVRGSEISQQTLTALPATTYDQPPLRSRVLQVRSPILRGLDVRLVQLALSGRRYKIVADGIFGNNSAEIVRRFQNSKGFPVSGNINNQEVDALGL